MVSEPVACPLVMPSLAAGHATLSASSRSGPNIVGIPNMTTTASLHPTGAGGVVVVVDAPPAATTPEPASSTTQPAQQQPVVPTTTRECETASQQVVVKTVMQDTGSSSVSTTTTTHQDAAAAAKEANPTTMATQGPTAPQPTKPPHLVSTVSSDLDEDGFFLDVVDPNHAASHQQHNGEHGDPHAPPTVVGLRHIFDDDLEDLLAADHAGDEPRFAVIPSLDAAALAAAFSSFSAHPRVGDDDYLECSPFEVIPPCPLRDDFDDLASPGIVHHFGGGGGAFSKGHHGAAASAAAASSSKGVSFPAGLFHHHKGSSSALVVPGASPQHHRKDELSTVVSTSSLSSSASSASGASVLGKRSASSSSSSGTDDDRDKKHGRKNGALSEARWAAERAKSSDETMPLKRPVGISLASGSSSGWRLRISGTQLGHYATAQQAWEAYPRTAADRAALAQQHRRDHAEKLAAAAADETSSTGGNSDGKGNPASSAASNSSGPED